MHLTTKTDILNSFNTLSASFHAGTLEAPEEESLLLPPSVEDCVAVFSPALDLGSGFSNLIDANLRTETPGAGTEDGWSVFSLGVALTEFPRFSCFCSALAAAFGA